MVNRNRRFAAAARLVALSLLIVGVATAIEADHLFQEKVAGGFDVAVSIRVAAYLLGAGGWLVISGAFGERIAWSRLRIGATIVAASYVAGFADSVFNLVPTLAHYQGDIRGARFWISVAALLGAVGVIAIVSGLGDSRRGTARASRIRVGAIFLTAAAAAQTVSALDYHFYFQAQGYVSELTTGALIAAVGGFGVAVAALIFVFGARRPLPAREARLAAAATVAALGTLCAVVGEAFVAIGYSTHGAPTWEGFVAWSTVAYSVVAVVYLVLVALGARAAAGELAPGVRA